MQRRETSRRVEYAGLLPFVCVTTRSGRAMLPVLWIVQIFFVLFYLSIPSFFTSLSLSLCFLYTSYLPCALSLYFSFTQFSLYFLSVFTSSKTQFRSNLCWIEHHLHMFLHYFFFQSTIHCTAVLFSIFSNKFFFHYPKFCLPDFHLSVFVGKSAFSEWSSGFRNFLHKMRMD